MPETDSILNQALVVSHRFRFSLLNLAYAIALIAFSLAASRDEGYTFSALLRSGCVGVLIYGLALQSLDLAKARLRWNSATWEEGAGRRMAILVRCLVIIGLIYCSFADVGSLLETTVPEDSEFNIRVDAVSDALEPLMLICGLAFAPWCWRRTNADWKKRLDVLIALTALAALLAVTWYSASFMTAMVHIAIHGVSLSEPIQLDTLSPSRTSAWIQFTHEASFRAWSALGLAIAGAGALYMGGRTKHAWLRYLLWAVATISVTVSLRQVLWLKQVAFPRISPLLAGSVHELEPRLIGVIAGAALFIGALSILWIEVGRPPEQARSWRRTLAYPQETRFFYELLVFSIALENLEIFQQIMAFFGEFGSIVSSLGFNVSDIWVSLIGVLSTFFYEPLQMAILVLALGGLFHRRKDQPFELAQTPGPASIPALILGIPVAALCTYLIAEAMLWSNFLYWITAT